MIIREFLVSWSKMTPYSQKLRNIAMLKNSLIQCLKWVDANRIIESMRSGGVGGGSAPQYLQVK